MTEELKENARITILKAREDSEGWYAEAAGYEGRKHFAFAGAGRMLANTAQVASDLLDRIAALEDALAARDATIQALMAERDEAQKEAQAHLAGNFTATEALDAAKRDRDRWYAAYQERAASEDAELEQAKAQIAAYQKGSTHE